MLFDQHIETRTQQLMGIVASLASALGLSDEEIREDFGPQIGQTISNLINDEHTTFWESKARAGKKTALIMPPKATGKRLNRATLPPESHPKRIEERWLRIAEAIRRG
ncbi:hypothetical protein [Sneathiella chinensis]|uniref:Uncharacterized protein n=1 Tax=Sneathiella chinensis TaxID=349750 RepID=A0ABQ5U6F0_9PROT|nr:hypothetical protein [Sneathiella chinensis]GLQ06834.1 hypothetical protein GCM10007924_20550 [Sneathiella chinensis]